MGMPTRNFEAGSGYRYGFNGKESDDETYGNGNIYDYGFRIYNPRLGKFLSVDPLTSEYPELTPYQFASNRPIDGIDLDGLEYYVYHILIDRRTGKIKLLYIEDLTNMSNSEVQRVHHMTKVEFLQEHSVTYGGSGQNNMWKYTIIDKNGNVRNYTVLSENSTFKFGRLKYEYYGNFSGSGAVTKWGPKFEHDYNNNPYALWRKPISMGDAIAKGHDVAENEPNYAGRMSMRYLKADIIFVRQLHLLIRNSQDPNYIDPFTNRHPSEDDIAYAETAIDYFNAFIIGPKIKELIENKGQYTDQWIYENLTKPMTDEVILPVPNPSDGIEPGPLEVKFK